jgi:hypothetical protein
VCGTLGKPLPVPRHLVVNRRARCQNNHVAWFDEAEVFLPEAIALPGKRGVVEQLPVPATAFYQRRGDFAKSCAIPEFERTRALTTTHCRQISKSMKMTHQYPDSRTLETKYFLQHPDTTTKSVNPSEIGFVTKAYFMRNSLPAIKQHFSFFLVGWLSWKKAFPYAVFSASFCSGSVLNGLLTRTAKPNTPPFRRRCCLSSGS